MGGDLGASTLVGRRLGTYQVQALLGAGGMGEVYRARDTKLGRDVALKILPHASTSDPEQLARFEREARMLAALNHPNIGSIYGFENADGIRALVLELVDGETLADRIARGPLPLREALPIARQIADALDAAHDKGIVHRDLKPANVKVTTVGVVKVLDFGIAKISDPSAGDESTDAVTMTIKTQEGEIIGTPAYMSPEQARGSVIDKRTDIWAYGCLLYELLTGQAAFAGETRSDTIARILERDPDWSGLPTDTPPDIRRLIGRCLEKETKRRLRDIGEAQIVLEEAFTPRIEPRQESEQAARGRPWRWVLASAGLVVIALGVWAWMTLRGRDTLPLVTRMTVNLPAGHELDLEGGAMPLAVAPDGRRLAYVARGTGRRQLHVRELDAFEARSIAGTENARHPFFSPDGRAVAFFADGKLKRVSIDGGSPVIVCDAPLAGHGGTWGDEGTIVFDPGASGLMRVAAGGGKPELVKSQNPEIDGGNLLWPHLLPGGRGLLATRGGNISAALAVLSFETGTWREIGRGFQAQYLPPGFILFHASAVREGELHVIPFDLATLATTGPPVSVLDGVFRPPAGGGIYFAAAAGGTLVFARGGQARTLVRVDRNGRRTPLLDERRGFRLPSVSPDGRHVAVTIDPRPSEVWVYDLARRAGARISTEGHSLGPRWTADGRRIAWSGGPEGDRGSYWRAADGSTAAELLLKGQRSVETWSGDGQFLVFNGTDPTTRGNLWIQPPRGESAPLIGTPADEYGARLSPDNRWLAYVSNESGRGEVYVRPFPNVDAGKWPISASGGQSPVWSPTGRELFYLNGSAMMRTTIEANASTFRSSAPEVLFTGPFETGSPDFDITPDGAYFVMVEADPDAKPTQIHVVLNWLEELKRGAVLSP
jgi:Tol biopolymer transport system component